MVPQHSLNAVEVPRVLKIFSAVTKGASLAARSSSPFPLSLSRSLSLCSHPLAPSAERSLRGLSPQLLTNVHLIKMNSIAQLPLLITLLVKVVRENYLF